MLFSDNLKKLRRANNMSQDDFAEMLGVSRQAVSEWELGNGYPEVKKLLIIHDKFNVSLEDLFFSEILANDSPNAKGIPDYILPDDEIDKLAQEVVRQTVPIEYFDDCMVAIRDSMVPDLHNNKFAQSRIRHTLWQALMKGANMDIGIAYINSDEIVSSLKNKIQKAINLNSAN